MKYPFLFFVLLSFLLRLFRRSLPLFPFLGRRGFFCILRKRVCIARYRSLCGFALVAPLATLRARA